MEQLLALNTWLNDLVWGPPFMVLLFGDGGFEEGRETPVLRGARKLLGVLSVDPAQVDGGRARRPQIEPEA